MERKPRILIYDRKEMTVLVLLAIMVSIFAFTLGVHLGKRVGIRTAGLAPRETSPIETRPDLVPNRQELTEQSKAVHQAVDESLNQELHDEVARTGVKLEVPRQVDLPKKPRTGNAGATTVSEDGKKLPLDPAVDLAAIPAAQRPVPAGKFTIQIGSFPAIDEARDQLDAMEALGIKPFLRAAEVKGKGKWFRIYVGGYGTKDAAEKAGEQYRARHVIDSFIVAKSPER